MTVKKIRRWAFIEHNQELRETYAVLATFVGSGPVPVDLENGYLFRGEAAIETTSYACLRTDELGYDSQYYPDARLALHLR